MSNDSSSLNRMLLTNLEHKEILKNAHLISHKWTCKWLSEKCLVEFNSKEPSKYWTKSIENFEWSSKERMTKIIKNYLNKINVIKLVKINDFESWDSMNNKTKVSKLAEKLFRSWSRLFDKNPKTMKQVDWLFNKIITRTKTIIYLVKSPIKA